MKLLTFCRKAKALASRALHGWYEKRLTVEDLLAEADGGRFTWIGAGGAAVECCAAGPGFPGMQRAQDELPALLVEDENWRFQPLAPDACLVIGRFRLTTIPESGLVLSEQQRATFLFRADGEAVRLCHIHISSPAGRKRRSLYAFDEPAARREYMGELAARRLAGRFPELTKRQVKVLCFLMQGLPYKDIADAMNITPRTVRYYVTEIERRLHAENRTLLIETVLQRNTGGVISAYGDVRRKTPARVFFSCPPVSRRAQGRGPLWLGGLIKKIYTGTSGTAVGREVKGNGGNSYNFYRFIVVSWQTTKEGGIGMKMKKAYAAALAAAMVLTAGFSAQAAQVKLDRVESAIAGADDSIMLKTENVQAVANNQDFTFNNVEVKGTLTGTDGTFTGDLSGKTILGNGGLIGGVGMEKGQVVANNGIYAANGDFNVDGDGNVEGVNGTFTGDVSGVNGTFTGTVSGELGDFDAINAGNSLVGGVGLENGHIIAEDGIYAGNNNQFHVDANGNMTTEGNVVANTVEGTLIKGDYGMFGNTAISANDGIVMNKVTEAADGSTTNEEVFKVDKDGNVSTNGAMSVAQGANINGGLAVNGGAAINGGLTVDGTDVMGSIADNADKIAQNTTAIANNSSRINALNSRVSDLGNEIDNVGAISSALAGLHPLDYDGTGSKFQLAAAMGSYDGSQAAAIGGFYHFNEDVMMSVGGATAFDGDNKSAFNVGVSFRIGQGSSGKKVNSDDVLAQLNAMNEKIAALEAENQQLSEKVAALEGGEGAEAAEAE